MSLTDIPSSKRSKLFGLLNDNPETSLLSDSRAFWFAVFGWVASISWKEIQSSGKCIGCIFSI